MAEGLALNCRFPIFFPDQRRQLSPTQFRSTGFQQSQQEQCCSLFASTDMADKMLFKSVSIFCLIISMLLFLLDIVSCNTG
jgi:hypothetical protein